MCVNCSWLAGWAGLGWSVSRCLDVGTMSLGTIPRKATGPWGARMN